MQANHFGEQKRVTDAKSIYTFNTVVTGRCNTACSYCHFYATRNRRDVAYDISDELFETYMRFIKRWSEKIDGITSYRFSGGDPMVLKDRLFKLADTGYDITGIKPFMLTAGKALSKAWVSKAKSSALSHVFVSVENPINPDPKAPDPNKVIDSILELNSKELPIVPGVCVVPNNALGHIDEICEWFYERLGRIPLICEVNYAPYESPTEEEIRGLKASLGKALERFFGKTPLNMFSSVVPEYAYGGIEPFLSDLALDNPHQISENNFDEKIDEMVAHIESINYPRLTCSQSECPWNKFCGNTKWYWQGDGRNFPETKLADYCKFKKAISGVFYKTLVDPSFIDPEDSIDIAGSIWTPRPVKQGK